MRVRWKGEGACHYGIKVLRHYVARQSPEPKLIVRHGGVSIAGVEGHPLAVVMRIKRLIPGHRVVEGIDGTRVVHTLLALSAITKRPVMDWLSLYQWSTCALKARERVGHVIPLWSSDHPSA